jgi:hypothetical protein
VLYEMLYGQRPFQAATKMATLAAIIREEPKPLSEMTAALPPALEKLGARCLRDRECCVHSMVDKVVQLGRHLVGDGVPHRLSVAASSHPAAAQARESADEYVAQHGLLSWCFNRRYVLREGAKQNQRVDDESKTSRGV